MSHTHSHSDFRLRIRNRESLDRKATNTKSLLSHFMTSMKEPSSIIVGCDGSNSYGPMINGKRVISDMIVEREVKVRDECGGETIRMKEKMRLLAIVYSPHYYVCDTRIV